MMSVEDRVAVQDEIAKDYLRRMDKRDAERREEVEEAELLRQAQIEREALDVARANRWSNGPCVYCGFSSETEVRSMGPIHLQPCLARYTTVQRRKQRSK